MHTVKLNYHYLMEDVKMEHTYKFTDKEILAIIRELSKIKAHDDEKTTILDLIMQGGGR